MQTPLISKQCEDLKIIRVPLYLLCLGRLLGVVGWSIVVVVVVQLICYLTMLPMGKVWDQESYYLLTCIPSYLQ